VIDGLMVWFQLPWNACPVMFTAASWSSVISTPRP